MSKDWKGNTNSVFKMLGASNHAEHDREKHDFYETEPRAIPLLLEQEVFDGTIWENACGRGALSIELEKAGYTVISTDLIDRGYGTGGIDFFKCTESLGDNILSNPPYSFAKEWVFKSMELLQEGKKLALFLKIQFLESDDRRDLFKKYPPKVIYCCSSRLVCALNGDFRAKDKQGNILYDKNGNAKKMSSATFYCWYVWEKGWFGDPVIKWIN